MKAITIWQPYASLLACGEKWHETRTWATNYRGQVAIHAAVKDPRSWLNPCIHYDFVAEAERALHGALLYELPRGCVIATGKLVECWKIIQHTQTAIILKQSNGIGEDKISINDQRLLFGDYSIGRYVWGFVNMTSLPEPIPAKGKQRIWNWTPTEG